MPPCYIPIMQLPIYVPTIQLRYIPRIRLFYIPCQPDRTMLCTPGCCNGSDECSISILLSYFRKNISNCATFRHHGSFIRHTIEQKNYVASFICYIIGIIRSIRKMTTPRSMHAQMQNYPTLQYSGSRLISYLSCKLRL